MFSKIQKLMDLGAILEKFIEPCTGEWHIRCRFKEKIVSKLILDHQDLITPELGEEKINNWVEETVKRIHDE